MNNLSFITGTAGGLAIELEAMFNGTWRNLSNMEIGEQSQGVLGVGTGDS